MELTTGWITRLNVLVVTVEFFSLSLKFIMKPLIQKAPWAVLLGTVTRI
jgi:phosphoribulokinase